jgi:hypothetical protein
MIIWKYPLEVTDRVGLAMPPGALFLDIQVQNGVPCLWALVDETKQDYEDRSIAIYGTGHPLPEELGKYIASFQMMFGGLVFHAFEVDPK